MARKPAAASASIWWRQEYQDSGKPWHNSTGGPSPCSAMLRRMPLLSINRCVGPLMFPTPSTLFASASRERRSTRAPSLLFAELEPVEIHCRLREQRGLFGFAVWRGDALEGVEDHLIAALALVRRKIAFEHAARGAECLDAGFDIGTPCYRCFFRRRRHRTFVKIITEQAHRQPAEFYHDIGAFGDFPDRCLPLNKCLFTPVGEAAAADRAAAMIEHDLGVRKGAGEIGQFRDLRMKQPCVEA